VIDFSGSGPGSNRRPTDYVPPPRPAELPAIVMLPVAHSLKVGDATPLLIRFMGLTSNRDCIRRCGGHRSRVLLPRVLPSGEFSDREREEILAKTPDIIGDPERTRTSDLRFRKPLLYPAELRDR
jgi:hypothetical protein